MADRFVLYDALHSLNNGAVLVRFSDISISQYLSGCPQISLVSERLIKNKWVVPINKSEFQWVITKSGMEMYREGREMHERIPFSVKLMGRLGFTVDWEKYKPQLYPEIDEPLTLIDKAETT